MAAVGVILDGCPARLPITTEEIQFDLDRRRPGQSRLVTQRSEADRVEILSGVFDRGRTKPGHRPSRSWYATQDQNPGAYDHLKDVYRPSHADYTYDAKFGFRAITRGGGRGLGRETIGRVAAGAIARKLLATVAGIEVARLGQLGPPPSTPDPRSRPRSPSSESRPTRPAAPTPGRLRPPRRPSSRLDATATRWVASSDVRRPQCPAGTG